MKKILSEIESGKIAPVYCLYGNEPGPIRKVVTAIRATVLEPAMEAFNHERFAGREVEGVGQVLEACAQLPMMAKYRLVELDDPELVGKVRGKSGADVAKASLDALVRYIQAPNPTTVLVMVSGGIDGRSRLVTATKKIKGVVAKFEQIRRDRDAVDFVAAQAGLAGVTVEREAAAILVELVGTAQSELIAAVERAIAHAGPNQPVGREDVLAVAAPTREAVIFELTDAVGLGHRDRALSVLAALFRETSAGEIGQSNAVLAMLIRQLRLVFMAKAAGGQPSAIERIAGVPNFVARKLSSQAQGFDEHRLRRAYAGLARIDRDLKGGSYAVARAPYIALQRWILEVCGGLPGAAPRV